MKMTLFGSGTAIKQCNFETRKGSLAKLGEIIDRSRLERDTNRM